MDETPKVAVPEIFKKPEDPVKPLVEESKVEPKYEEPEHVKILREHNYMESNIPINHHYWRIRP